ncbi:MAG: hypothetical protein F7B17_03535 [Desulfurococcales archaeon]|nr:hypothetical protein [Desulfurococcales archaeon]
MEIEPLPGPLRAEHYYTLIILVLAGLFDVVYREVDPLYWYLAGKAGFLLSLADAINMGIPPKVYMTLIAISLAPALGAFLLYRLCLLGGSDVWALAFIAVSSPLPVTPYLPIPPSIAAAGLGGVVALVYYIFKLLSACGIPCLLRGSVKVSSRELVYSSFYRWWLPKASSGGSCTIEQSAPEVAASKGGYVEASPGIPLGAGIALGYAIYLVLTAFFRV